KSVFVAFPFKKTRFDFTSKDFSLTFQFKYFETFFGKLITKSQTDSEFLRNVTKSTVGIIQVSVLNANDIVNLSDFTNFRPGLSIKLGAQRNVDKIEDNFDKATWGGGFNLYGSFDNFKLYETENNQIKKKYPVSYGLEGNITFFPPNTRKMILALNANIGKGFNDNGLKNFKELNSVTLTPTVVAFEKFDGKFGKLETDLFKARFTASAPMTFGNFQPIPYLVFSSIENDEPAYFVGIYLNLLAKKMRNFRIFNIPSSFGIGADWRKISGTWSSINVFIRGSISFDEIL
ncbi:MAG: hypothetical protein MUF12_00430, partial [Sediminibacterium sp.]|nr:hypothetical protein [Sediminibacterium sp.]